MNETRSQQEPSMEEILASIRRIISEDGLGSRAGFDSREADEAPADLAMPKSRDEISDSPKTENKDTDILVLTEMLAEDGSVVSLTPSADVARSTDPAPATDPARTVTVNESETPKASGAALPPELPADPDNSDAELPTSPAESASASPQTVKLAPPAPAPAEPKLTEPKLTGPKLTESDVPTPQWAKPEPSVPDLAENDLAENDLAGSDSAEGNPAESDLAASNLAARNPAELEEPSEAAEPARPDSVMALPDGADHKMENEAVSTELGKKLDIVSKEAETASTAALTELARTVAREREQAIAGGRMVEDLVREALQPMLKQWLDTNLPGLVERLVRDEIQRLTRRAEDSV